MIAVDTNILVYAYRADLPRHAVARQRLVELAEGAAPWAIPWPCIHEFLAVVTQPALALRPSPLARALDDVTAILASPAVSLLSETSNHWDVLRALIADSDLGGRKIHDAKIAAICIQHGITEFWSADRDFNRFRDFRVVNPLAEG